MKKSRTILALILALLMPLCAAAQEAPKGNIADFEALYPLMDLTTMASYYAGDTPVPVPGADSALTVAFTDAFFKAGQTFAVGAQVGVQPEMLSNPSLQADLLGRLFAAQLPVLEPVTVTEGVNQYIGFQPVTVNGAVENGVQIIGEIYLADQSIRNMTVAEYASVQWIDRGIFTFIRDDSAINGYRLTSFTVGLELMKEAEFQQYFDNILTEYVDNQLGFTVLYPAVFTEEMLEEDTDGVSAELPDGSVSFFAKRVANMDGATLSDYVGVIANGITDSVSTVNEELRCGTVFYITEDGRAVFDVYILTDRYIYQAELNCLTSLIGEYAMFNSYLQNSFVVDEVSVG